MIRIISENRAPFKKERDLNIAKKFNQVDRLNKVTRELLDVEGVVDVEVDLDSLPEIGYTIFVIKYDISFDPSETYFERRQKQKIEILKVLNANNYIRTPDTWEDYGEHWYIVTQDAKKDNPVIEEANENSNLWNGEYKPEDITVDYIKSLSNDDAVKLLAWLREFDSTNSSLEENEKPEFQYVTIEMFETTNTPAVNFALNQAKGKKFTDPKVLSDILVSADAAFRADGEQGYSKVYFDSFVKYKGDLYKFHYGRVDLGDGKQEVELPSDFAEQIEREFEANVKEGGKPWLQARITKVEDLKW